MRVLVDTSVWSLVLRRSGRPGGHEPHAAEMRELISEQRAHLIGPVRQEILSGIRTAAQYELLREKLRSFEDIPLSVADYERAAEFFNACRARGIQGSNTDFLICAVAVNHDLAVYTTDTDFTHFRTCVPFRLHAPRSLRGT